MLFDPVHGFSSKHGSLHTSDMHAMLVGHSWSIRHSGLAPMQRTHAYLNVGPQIHSCHTIIIAINIKYYEHRCYLLITWLVSNYIIKYQYHVFKSKSS